MKNKVKNIAVTGAMIIALMGTVFFNHQTISLGGGMYEFKTPGAYKQFRNEVFDKCEVACTIDEANVYREMVNLELIDDGGVFLTNVKDKDIKKELNKKLKTLNP